MGNETVLCQVCQGVLPASGRDAYTTLRGRLIVTNGYCRGGCVPRSVPAAEETRRMQRPVAPQGAPHAAPPGGPQGVPYRAQQMPSQVAPSSVPPVRV